MDSVTVADSAALVADSEMSNTDNRDEVGKVLCNVSVLKLLYFEHNYAENSTSLSRMYQNLPEEPALHTAEVTDLDTEVTGPHTEDIILEVTEAEEVAPEADEAAPKADEAAPETKKAAPAAEKATLETGKNAPKDSGKVPGGNEKAPEDNKKPPEFNEKTPEGNEKTPEGNEKVLDGNKKTSEGDEKAPAGNEKVLERTEKALEKNERTRERNEKALERNEKALERDEKALERNEKALERNEKASERNENALERNEKASERNEKVPETSEPETVPVEAVVVSGDVPRLTTVQNLTPPAGPVRRSQRQINKPEKDNLKRDASFKTEIDDSNILPSEKNMTCEKSSETNAVIKQKSPKKENKTINDISLKKILQNHEIGKDSITKILKKSKMSEVKVTLEEPQEIGLKHKVNLLKSKGLERKIAINVANMEARRKRANSEPSNDLGTSALNKEEVKDSVKKKRLRGMSTLKSPLSKAKKCEKLDIGTNPKKRKRNVPALSDKGEIPKTSMKKGELIDKCKRKKCLSLSEESTNETVKIEKKHLLVDSKAPTSKGPLVVTKPKQKKVLRRESLRLVINEDEPPLFSQPDVMIKVKSDDLSHKKEEKDLDGKVQSRGVTLSNADKSVVQTPVTPLNVAGSFDPPEIKKIDVCVKSEEIPQEHYTPTKELKDVKEADLSINDYSLEEHDLTIDFDTKDIDSENSLHIDESVEKDDSREMLDENTNNHLTESSEKPSVASPKDKKVDSPRIDDQTDTVGSGEVNDVSNVVQSNIDDLDSDKPIAERKPRRIIKKKEFFEDITSRSSTQTKKSGGRQKATDKKSQNEEESKQGKKNTKRKPEVDEYTDESSEDDPEKLWCICRKPHNDRFMIQCDICEDWFHGSCVGITRQQGRKLEKQQKEWKCPNCLSKGSNAPDGKIVSEQKTEVSEQKTESEDKKAKASESNQMMTDEKDNLSSSTISPKIDKSDKISKAQGKINLDHDISTSSKQSLLPSFSFNKKGIVKSFNRNAAKELFSTANIKKPLKEAIKKKYSCVTCQTPAIPNTCYCSDKCMEKHATDCLAIMRETKATLKGSDFNSEKVVVLDRVKGTVIAGDNAPTTGEILSWLKANPTFMIACSTYAVVKKEQTIQKKDAEGAASARKETSDESSKATVRFNVRKTLKNILMDRCKNADDIQLPEEDIRKIAVKIEEELHSLFKDNSFKYRAKYRSLMFNIKDPRNQGLFRKILKGNIPPDKLVRMSPEELASMELAKWREQENQHLLDMIKRVQLEQQSGSCLLKKTHKGEVEIEDDFTSIIDDVPKTTIKAPAEEVVEPVKLELDKVVVKDTTLHHRSHLFDLNCKICTGKILPPPVEDNTPKKIRVAHSISVDLSSPATIDNVEKNISRIVDGKSPLSSTGDDSLDQEPTSTVSIGSPETSVRFASENEKNASSVWKGFIYMQDVAKFVTSAYKVSGQTDYLNVDVPDTIQVCGRIIPDQVWDYLGKIKQSGNKELIIIRFQAANDEEAVTYNSFYSYLSSRKRYGVVSNYSKKIKDFYILPLAATSPVPIVLMPFDGPGLPSPRPHLLLGVIVRHKSKQANHPLAKKEKSKEDIEAPDGSYTPPLDNRSYTPPLPPLQTDNSVNIAPDTVYNPSADLKSKNTIQSSEITPTSVVSCDDKNKDDSEPYEPSYTPPLQIVPTDCPKDKEDDKPYDPGQDIHNIEAEKKESKSSPKENIDSSASSNENLEKHKKILDALTRQVEETDRQVNALKILISQPEDSEAEVHSPGSQLDINCVTASGMSSFLDLPENLQDILNVVREKSLDKDKSDGGKGDVDMRINDLFRKSRNISVEKLGSADSDKISSTPEKSSSLGATPPPDDNEEEISSVMRPSDPRIKLRTSFQESSFSSEEPTNTSLSNMSVTELMERAEKELAELKALETSKQSSQSASSNQDKLTSSLGKISSWNQFKEPPPPGIELADLPDQESTFSCKTSSSTSASDSSLPSSFTSPLIPDSQQIGTHFPPPSIPSSFPPRLPPGFSIQTPPPNIKNFPPPNVISTSFPPPPLPVVSKASDANPINKTWPSWNVSQQSKDSTWQNRVPQWDENWKHASETPAADCSESSSHYYPPGSNEFQNEQFYRNEPSSEGRWNRPTLRFGRNNWHKRPRGSRWRGRRPFLFNKNPRH